MKNPHPKPLPEYRERGQDFALLVLHPIEPKDRAEYARASLILNTLQQIPFPRIILIHPNNDPGSRGIARCWNERARGERFEVHRNLDRAHFLGLLRRAAVLVGNSSSGIIEAASFGTPVIDIGPRQLGRERSGNVTNVPYRKAPLLAALKKVWNSGKPLRFKGRNVYGGNGAGRKIANVLSSIPLSDRIRRKLIAY
jgi:UDP-N-acetylglucosamine 2-epimerase